MLNVGIIGCGNVAPHHIRFLTEIRDCRVVALADTHVEHAQSLAQRYGIPHCYDTLDELLDSMQIDVLHILTPPASHYAQARLAIDRGVHVFVEKPLALQVSEVADLYERAAAKAVSICPDFIQLFHPCMSKAISIVTSGDLGELVHCEAHLAAGWGLIPQLHEPVHLNWAYNLPGGILHNYITHPLYLLLYWIGSPGGVVVNPKSFGTLPQGLTDHLDILIESGRRSGHITLSLATKAGSYWLGLYCQKGSAIVNFETRSLLVEREGGLSRSLNRATASFKQGSQLFRSNIANVIDALRGTLVPYEGLNVLLQEYYSSLKEHRPPPISRELAISVAKAEEAITVNSNKTHLNLNRRPSQQLGIRHNDRVVVTGASGYVGTELVRRLVEAGYYVRALVRPLSRTRELERLGVEIIYGDVRDYSSLVDAFENIDIVVHAAAGMRGTPAFIIDSCVAGTTNVAKAARATGADRVIYISSIGVYDFVALRERRLVTEEAPLEKAPQKRGIASMAKRKAEDVALDQLKDHHTEWTILRPSVIFGQGRDPLSLVGTKLGKRLVCFGSDRKHLRLIHAGDLASAVLTTIQTDSTRGKIFVLSHTDVVTVRQYLDLVSNTRDRQVSMLYIPYWLALLGTVSLQLIRVITRKGPELSRERLAYLYSDLSVDSSSFMKQTLWKPSGVLCDQLASEATNHSEGVKDALSVLPSPQLSRVDLANTSTEGKPVTT